MTPQITLSSALFAKLQSLAEPFVDTPETVISRAIEFYTSRNDAAVTEHSSSPTGLPVDGPVVFSAEAAPNMTFTRPVAIELDGKKFDKATLYWNPLLFEVIRLAALRLKDQEKLKELLRCNFVDGKKDDGGYRFINEAGLSVQGQAANPAWKSIMTIVKGVGLSLQATFVWEDRQDAAFPGKTGKMAYSGS